MRKVLTKVRKVATKVRKVATNFFFGWRGYGPASQFCDRVEIIEIKAPGVSLRLHPGMLKSGEGESKNSHPVTIEVNHGY